MRRVRGVTGRLDDGLLLGHVVAGLMDKPHLDEVRLALQFARDQRTRGFGRFDLDDRRIAEVELDPVDHRDQRTGNLYARRRSSLGGDIAHVEIPERAADVDHAGDAAGDPDLERRRQPRLVARSFLRIRHHGVEVGAVGARVQVPRLEKVHVAVDHAGNEPLALAVEARRTGRHGRRRARTDRDDAIAGDHDRCIRHRRGGAVALGIDDRDADDGQLAGTSLRRRRSHAARSCRQDRRQKTVEHSLHFVVLP